MKNEEKPLDESLAKVEALKAKYKDDPPYTIEQCIVAVLAECDQPSKDFIKQAESPDSLMSILGGNLGQTIRNRYHLWFRPLERNLHADDFSYEVVYNVWILLKQL